MIHNAILFHVENIAIPRHRLNNATRCSPLFQFHPSHTAFILSISFCVSVSPFLSLLVLTQTSDQLELDPNFVFTRFLRPSASRTVFRIPWNKVNSSFFAALSTPLFLLASPLRPATEFQQRLSGG